MFVHQPHGLLRSHRKADGQLQSANPAGSAAARCFRDRRARSRRRSWASTPRSPAIRRWRRCGRSATSNRIARWVTPEEILQEAKTFREKKLPCDAMIYLGTDFCPNGWNTHNGEFTWNAKAFPDPAGRHQRIARRALQSGAAHRDRRPPRSRNSDRSLHRGAAAQRPHCRWPLAWRPPGELLLAGAQAAARSRRRWLVARSRRWARRASRLARNRMYFEGQQMYRPNERVFALHRNGNAGMQRYRVVPVVGRRAIPLGNSEDPCSQCGSIPA